MKCSIRVGGTSFRDAMETAAPFGEVVIVPVYHPAAALYDRDLLDVLREDFSALKRKASSNTGDQTA